MSITRRLLIGAAQIFGATVVGYIVAFITIATVSDSFAVGLVVAAIIGGLVIAGIGRLFKMRGQWRLALIAALIGAAIGYAILQTPIAVRNATLWAVLVFVPGILGTVAYHGSDSRR